MIVSEIFAICSVFLSPLSPSLSLVDARACAGMRGYVRFSQGWKAAVNCDFNGRAIPRDRNSATQNARSREQRMQMHNARETTIFLLQYHVFFIIEIIFPIRCKVLMNILRIRNVSFPRTRDSADTDLPRIKKFSNFSVSYFSMLYFFSKNLIGPMYISFCFYSILLYAILCFFVQFNSYKSVFYINKKDE